jgi:hypothetical protein
MKSSCLEIERESALALSAMQIMQRLGASRSLASRRKEAIFGTRCLSYHEDVDKGQCKMMLTSCHRDTESPIHG